MRAGRMLIFARVSGGRSRDDVIRTTRVDEAMHARVYVHGAVYIYMTHPPAGGLTPDQ